MAFPSDSARTKNWSTETLTDADLEGQFDILHTYFKDALNASTGHNHDGTSNQGPKLTPANLVIASQAQGDILYASSASAWARLGAGTNGYFLKTQGAGANPVWASISTLNVPRSCWNNLAVSRTNTTTVDVTADELVLQNTSFDSVRITGVSESIAITTSGAGGLVTALSEAANTIYYIWIARKSSDGTVNGFLSTSAVFATVAGQLDSGYDQLALVSCVGNDNSSNFIDFKQNGKRYNFTTWATMASGSASAWTSVDLTPANMSTNAGFVPSALSTMPRFSLAGKGVFVELANTNSATSTNDYGANKVNLDASNLSMALQTTVDMDVLTADTVYWGNNGSAAALYLNGFEINKLG